MRFKWLKASFLSFSLAALPLSAQALVIGPFGPLQFGEAQTPQTLYVVSNVGANGGFSSQPCVAAGRCFVIKEYPYLDVASDGNSVITLAVTGFSATNQTIQIASIATNTTTTPTVYMNDSEFEIVSAAGATSVTSNSFTVTSGTVQVDLAISLRRQCQLATINGFCSGGEVIVPTAGGSSNGIIFSLIETRTGDARPLDAATYRNGTQIKIVPQFTAPQVTTCPGSGSYGETVFYPGDSEITFHTSNFRARQGDPPGSALFTHFRVAAGKSPMTLPTDATVLGGLPYQGGDQKLEGFENSTANQTITYDAFLGVSDSSGAVQYCPTKYSGIFASDIQGFLGDSNCFIATATYENSYHPVVLFLREFRDQVLLSSSVGRMLTQTYYRFSPDAAQFLIEHFWLRPLVKRALQPIVFYAWLFMHPALLIGLLAMSLVLLLRSRKRAKTALGLFILIGLVMSSPSVQAASNQPYIDSLLSQLPPKPAEPKESFTESEKKKLGPAEKTSYTEDQRRVLGGPNIPSAGYTEGLKKTVGTRPGGDSAIADLQSNKQLEMKRGDRYIRSAMSLKLATAMNRTYTAGAKEDRPYETVYGTGWQPDFHLNYEYRPYPTDPIWSSLGVMGGLGFTVVRGKGQYAYVSSFGSESDIRFNFISMPLYVGPVLRFRLTDWFVPFVGLAGGAIGFYETHSDRKPSAMGYSFMYMTQAGVNFGLNWISKKSTWERYDDNLIKNLYFTVEYQRFKTISGLVDATIDGVNAGFLFEF